MNLTLATVLFALAVAHTFSIRLFQRRALRYPEGSILENLFHLLGEVEIVFGLWAGVLVAAQVVLSGSLSTLEYLEGLNFSEPFFVFVVMSVASTHPLITTAREALWKVARLLPIHRAVAFYFILLSVGPLLGSLITEPAAMTVTALLLRDAFFENGISTRMKYVTIAVLFVNVSIGGVLTHFAAPPVLMVVDRWGWGLSHMFSQFGWKAIVGVVVNAAGATALGYRELVGMSLAQDREKKPVPRWLVSLHALTLSAVVVCVHFPVVFVGLFLFFIGVVQITREYQEELKIRESLLVGFFLAGLVVLGGLQGWWLSPLLSRLHETALFLGATALTAIVDNAALTYLGAQVEGISASMKYSLVAGAVCGGGLTVIANAPNPAGFSILNRSFGSEGIGPGSLILYATLPTLIAMACFYWL